MSDRARSTWLAVVLASTLTCLATAAAQDCGEQWVGRMASAQGPSVEVRRAGSDRWLTVDMNDTFCAGDTLRVGPASRADLVLSNQSVLRIDQNTELKLEAMREQSTALLDLVKGAIHFLSRTIRGAEVRTRYTIAGVRGTEFLMRVEEGRAWVIVYEGAVLAQNPAGSITLQGGQAALVEEGRPPVLTAIARPRDAVQWALHYPAVIYAAPGAPLEGGPRQWAAEASRLLAVGRVEEADERIERALASDPTSADALALKTIILVVANQRELAMAAAQRAVSADPSSATARIALSYAQQAEFDLESARNSLQEAVALEPGNALAWARLSEVQMSLGYLDRALASARRAAAIDPALSRTQSVLGFAHLAQVDTEAARAAFEKAIALDQGDPLPRLGKGLAIIREGRLDEGGRQIEIAASLDPNNSIVRSYLGKTYYEEKRIGLDHREYATAKELDPRDPTPYFYDAIAKQTTNRPVEALEDYQKAIELNGNRAVYRSQLYLDEDLAARSAALAGIYRDLGFDRLGLVEGWKSVNTDPSNFSAHRFLSDSYAAQSRHEIARVSELLQSQLLQPINISPIQPRLAQSNLFLAAAQGPTSVSFNEFNPLFNRNQAAFQGSVLAGSNSTFGDEVVGSAIFGGTSFSAGQYYLTSDGFRKNSQMTDRIYSIFAQQQLSVDSGVQAEYRYRNRHDGDSWQRFFGDYYDPNLDTGEKSQLGRFGFRHAFAPGSTLIGNLMYQKGNDSSRTRLDPLVLKADAKSDEDAFGAELSFLQRWSFGNLVAGVGYFDVDTRDKLATDLQVPLPPPLPPLVVSNNQKFDRDVHHVNLYSYGNLRLPWHATFTLGASGDFFQADSGDEKDKNQLNPKLGITWNPLPDTTLRAAAFRTLNRTLIADQTLEPTQVAGFNQFFDEFRATEAWTYGAGIDQKFSSRVYAGAEFTYRNLNVPYTAVNPFTNASELSNADWLEKQLRAYAFWTPHDWFALSAEWRWQKLDREDNFAAYAEDVTTHTVPLGVSFFHPSGVSASFKGTYVDQKGRFSSPLDSTTFRNGDGDFWTFDASVSYRLPGRRGFITLGVANLTDEKFEYYDMDPGNPTIVPDRFFYTRLTLALP